MLKNNVNNNYLDNNIPLLSKTLITSQYTLGATSQRLVRPSYKKQYIITNMSRIENITRRVGLATLTTSASTVFPTASTQVTPSSAAGGGANINVMSFNQAHIYFAVSAVTGTWDIYAGSQGNTSYVVNSKKIVTGIALTGSYYAFLDKESLANNLSFYIEEISAGSITIDFEIVLKGGYGVSSGYTTNNTDNIAYLGLSSDVTISSGHPILAGEALHFSLQDDAELWGIGNGTNINSGTLEGVFVKVTTL